jgi:hypothetical protein
MVRGSLSWVFSPHKILCQFPPLSFMPAPLVASLLQQRSSLTPIVSSYSCRSCPSAIEIILAIAINRFLAIVFQRLLGMVPKWNGSRQTLCRLNPMPVNTQERMERRRCARSFQHRCSSIHPFIHCQFASSCCPSCTRPQPLRNCYTAVELQDRALDRVEDVQTVGNQDKIDVMDRPLDRPWRHCLSVDPLEHASFK